MSFVRGRGVMKIIIKILIGVLALVLAAIGGLYLTGNGMLLTIFYLI